MGSQPKDQKMTEVTLESFAMMQLLNAEKARELVHDMNTTPKDRDVVVGIWDETTGFCVRVYVLRGRPAQWFIRGPLNREQAREELLGPAPDTSSMH
jgi:hypothetical protein